MRKLRERVSVRLGERERPGERAACLGAYVVTRDACNAGKSSLLELIAGRITPQGGYTIRGRVAFDNTARSLLPSNERTRTHARYFGFVTQTDYLLPKLTVRETMLFSARLRLPQMSPEQREHRVDQLLREVGQPSQSLSPIAHCCALIACIVI